jgi:nitrogen fixation NifU-like protein
MSTSSSEQAQGTHRLGRIERPDGVAEGGNDCGDVIEVTLSVRDGRIQRALVAPRCCLTTLACALAAAALAEGKTPAEALREVGPAAVADAVGGLPDDHFRCAVLAADTVRKAVEDSLRTAREPWRRLYRT